MKKSTKERISWQGEAGSPLPPAAGGARAVHASPLPHWEHFEHKADVGVRGIGATKESAFEQAALAMLAVITNPELVRPSRRTEIRCKAPSDELLLVEWLNALVLQTATAKMLFSRFKVAINGHRLRAKVWGERVDVSRHEPAVEIKGATYTELSVQQDAAGHWITQCVVDV
jgi:tRNA nucleotidyltransferase (CCA-adding enzyme)